MLDGAGDNNNYFGGECLGMTDKQAKRFELMVRYIQTDEMIENLKNNDGADNAIKELIEIKKALRRELAANA